MLHKPVMQITSVYLNLCIKQNKSYVQFGFRLTLAQQSDVVHTTTLQRFPQTRPVNVYLVTMCKRSRLRVSNQYIPWIQIRMIAVRSEICILPILKEACADFRKSCYLLVGLYYTHNLFIITSVTAGELLRFFVNNTYICIF